MYPPEAKKDELLSIYARNFNGVELNSSFYNIPGLKAFAGMLRLSEGRVHWGVKIHQSMTRERNASDEDYRRLFESVAPLREAGVLGPFLAQFPQSFHRTPENRKYFAALAQRFADKTLAPGGLAVEFRHTSWDNEEVREVFRKVGLIWVSTDYPPPPRPAQKRAAHHRRNCLYPALGAQQGKVVRGQRPVRAARLPLQRSRAALLGAVAPGRPRARDPDPGLVHLQQHHQRSRFGEPGDACKVAGGGGPDT